MLIYNGQVIAGGGTIVLPMTRAEYEANKTILDSADVWVDLTDEPDQVAEADQIAYSVDNVQKGMGYIGDIATKAIAKVEPSDTALYAHAVGEYFINKDGELCRTTSAIQVGQTITVGTNCAVKSVGGEINDINSNLSVKIGNITMPENATGYAFVLRIGDLKLINYSVTFSSDMDTNAVLGTIPANFRPTQGFILPATLRVSGSNSIGNSTVSTDGSIKQMSTSICRGISISSFYK